jgi:thioredoxin 1
MLRKNRRRDGVKIVNKGTLRRHTRADLSTPPPFNARTAMSNPSDYATDAPSRSEIDALAGAAVLEFGTGWCGYCRAAQPVIEAALARHPGVRHIKVEDGPGRPLGRSFGVKLWPTLVFLRDGQEVARVVRPQAQAQLGEPLALIA